MKILLGTQVILKVLCFWQNFDPLSRVSGVFWRHICKIIPLWMTVIDATSPPFIYIFY